MNLSFYKKKFLIYLKEVRKYSDKTILTYKIALNQLEGNCEIEEQNGSYTINIMLFRIKIANFSKKAISTKLSAIRSFIKYLQTQEGIDIKLIGNHSIKTPQTLPKPIKKDAIFEALDRLELKEALIIKMLYGLGLRVSELSNIKLSDIKDDWIEIKGKGSKFRQVPIIKPLQKDIKNYLELYKPKEYMFEKKEKNLNSAQIRYIVQKSFKKIGIKATPHQLRHSFASHLLEEGARVSDVSELLGHSSMASTQIYTKLNNSLKLKNYLKAHPLVAKS